MRTYAPYILAVGVAAIALAAGCSGTPSTTSPMPMQPAAMSGAHGIGPGEPAAAGGRPTEILNWFATPPPGTSPTDFEFTLIGDWVAGIGQQPLYGPYNPFCPPSNGPSNPCYPGVTFSPSTDTTTVTYAGPTLYQNIPNHNGQVHFGLLAGFGPESQTPCPKPGWLNCLVANTVWTYPSAPPISQPFVNVNWSPKVTKGKQWRYAYVFVEASLTPKPPAAFGLWGAVAYVPNGNRQPTLIFGNYGQKTLYVLSSGIVPNQPVPSDPACLKNPACSENMAILAQLNYGGLPPPGSPSSPFVKLAHPPAHVLKPLKP